MLRTEFMHLLLVSEKTYYFCYSKELRVGSFDDSHFVEFLNNKLGYLHQRSPIIMRDRHYKKKCL